MPGIDGIERMEDSEVSCKVAQTSNLGLRPPQISGSAQVRLIQLT